MSQPDSAIGDLRIEHLDPGLARRVQQTVACRDCDVLPKVPHAGEVIERDGVLAQVMHNGVLVEEGGYFGDWMAEIIRALRGHHEPQEELVFATMVARVAAAAQDAVDGAPVMIEFGAFWAYYSLWFCHEIPSARAYGIEPDPAYLSVGRRNVELNGLGDRVRLNAGVVGDEPGAPLAFTAESDGVERPVIQYDLESLMDKHELDRAELVLIDIQGWELALLRRAIPLLEAGRVRFALVSTHHHSISGDALTHQRVRDLLVGAGATVLAEHTVGESASGDGLIAVSFDERDAGVAVDVTHVRAKDSLFGELEYDLATARDEALAVRGELADVQRQLAETDQALEVARKRAKRVRRRLRALRREHESAGRRGTLVLSARRRLAALRPTPGRDH